MRWIWWALCLWAMAVLLGNVSLEAVDSQEKGQLKETHNQGVEGMDPACTAFPGGPNRTPLLSCAMEEFADSHGERPVVALRGWRGFALQGEESQVLRVNIEAIMPVDPGEIRQLLASNASVEIIRERIRAEEKASVKRGSMQLGREAYQLENIAEAPRGNSTFIDAEVVKFDPGTNSTHTLGHITFTDFKDGDVAEGTLVMEDKGSSETYRVLLNADIRGHGPRRDPLDGPYDPSPPPKDHPLVPEQKNL